MNILNINQWKDLYKILKEFVVQENCKFSIYKIRDNKRKSIFTTVFGELLAILANKNKDLKSEILSLLQKVLIL